MILKNSRPYHYMLYSIRWHLLVVIIIIVAVALVEEPLRSIFDFQNPIAIPAFLGTAIVFVLGFRTNQAYDRWWEARKVWGAIVNDSRSWTRMVISLIAAQPEDVEEGVELKQRLIYRQVAWNYILAARLRELDPLEDMAGYFIKSDFEDLQDVDNPTQAILLQQSLDLKKALDSGRLHGLHHIELEECLRDLEAYMGKVERIKNTHFPVLYDKLILWAIYIFSGLLTLAIVEADFWFEVLFCVLISGIFLALEQIASDLQDPFENLPTDTPISSISHSIERGARQMLREGKEGMPVPPEFGKYYIN